PDIFGTLALVAEFLADDAVLGKVRLDQAAHHRFGGAVGLGDRIEIAGALVVDRERGPEERQDGLAGSSRKAPDEGCEIDDRHGCPLAELKCRLLPSSIRTGARVQRCAMPSALRNWLSSLLTERHVLGIDVRVVPPAR